MESQLNDMQCLIYVDSNESIEEMLGVLSSILQPLSVDKFFSLIVHEGLMVELLRNKDFSESERYQFPDGFLHFRYRVEIYADEPDLEASGNLLQALWDNDYPAVAACEDEDSLPEKGGYKSVRIPWPSIGR